MCASGIINLAQSGLDVLTHKVLKGNPIPINAALAAAGALAGIALTTFVTVRGRKFVAESRTGLDASGEHERLLSGGQVDYIGA